MPKLDEYRRKRNEGATNEPFGDDGAHATATLAGAFVVHLHDATRRHYDLRLEVGGVLASFAVPRGPSLDPDAKHLAMKTEDHPFEYLEFEDVIPAGQYGAGPMIVWDRGFVEYLEGPAEEELANDKLHVRVHGFKLRGAFALVKLKKSAKGDEWLLFKKADEHASTARDVLAELPRSVLSGLTVEELARRGRIGDELVAKAARAKRATRRANLAELFRPTARVLATAQKPTAVPPDGVRYDAELDGLRVLATKDDDVVALHLEDAQGTVRPIEAFYPDVVRALRSLAPARLALDATLVAFDPSGRPSFTRLAERATKVRRGDRHVVHAVPVVLVVEDVLALGDVDLRDVAFEARRELVERLLPAAAVVRAAPALAGDLDTVRGACAALGIGGVVAKPRGARYGEGWTRHPTGTSIRPRVAIDHGADDARAALRRVDVTNRSKIFFPDARLTKGDLCDYYAAVADVILRYLHARPIILVRYPDGIEGKSFFQWNVPPGMPPWVRTLTFRAEDEGAMRRGFFVDDPTTLLYVSNLGNIPIHILACRAPDLAQADFFTIDFDVKQSELRHAVTLAQTLKGVLDAAGLPGFAKTSGQTGLHVLCPLGPGQSWGTARALAELLGRVLVERHPDLATMERVVGRRGAKVYVDTGQTGATRAIVAPYSVRAVPGATVSTPLAWDEVEPALDPRAFTLRTVPHRLAKHGDPMKDLLHVRPDVPAAVAKLAALLGRG